MGAPGANHPTNQPTNHMPFHGQRSIFNNAEDEVAVLLFWQYVASLATLPLAISWVLRLLAPVAAVPGAWAGSVSASVGAGGSSAAVAVAAAATAVTVVAG